MKEKNLTAVTAEKSRRGHGSATIPRLPHNLAYSAVQGFELGEGPLLPMSSATFQVPSFCFFQTVVYFP